MRANWLMVALACVICSAFVYGCGGGSGSSSSASGRTVPVNVTISWGDRTRAISAPTSALSAVVRIAGAGAAGGDFTYSIDRLDTVPGYVQSYTSATEAARGTWNATVNFYAGKAGQGALVGVAAKRINLDLTNGFLGDIDTAGKVAAVTVAANQQAAVGQTIDLVFTATDAQGAVLAVSPGSARWDLFNNTGNLASITTSGALTGAAAGTVSVTATVDGKTSPLTPVTVLSADPVAPALVAEAAISNGAPSVRLRWSANVGSNFSAQQFQIYRSPDFAFSGGLIANGAKPPVTVTAGTVAQGQDRPSPFFAYAAGSTVAQPGATGCGAAAPSATLDTGFTAGTTYQYQLSVVASAVTGGACRQSAASTSGSATPIVPVAATGPVTGSTGIDPTQFNPQFTSRVGADRFQVEISTDATFMNRAVIFRQAFASTAPTSDGVPQQVGPIDITTSLELLSDSAFRNYLYHFGNAAAPTLYWRIGARHEADVPGPVHAISQDPADTDRTFRFVYSPVYSFTPK